jgi:integrase
LGTTDDHLFLSPRLKPLRYWDVSGVFHRLTDQLDLRRATGRKRPRIHDLRHHFARRVLERCPPGRAAIDRHMLAMSTYMGHVSVATTYCYLRTTPHLLEDISDACEAFAKGATA